MGLETSNKRVDSITCYYDSRINGFYWLQCGIMNKDDIIWMIHILVKIGDII